MACYFYGNPYRPRGVTAAKALERALAVYGEKIYADSWLAGQGIGEACGSIALLPGDVRAVVCFGGDGTLLRAAPEAAKRGLPLLGVHTGRVGFLMPGDPDDARGLARLLAEDACFRAAYPLLEVWLGQERFLCLNDVAVTRGEHPGVIETRVEADGERVFSAHGDGAVLASPLGATAYALSAGGPVIRPDLACILAVPLCPRELHLRPVLLPPTAQITLWAPGAPRRRLQLALDGQQLLPLESETTLRVSVAREQAVLLSPTPPAFFRTLRQKQSAWNQSEPEE